MGLKQRSTVVGAVLALAALAACGQTDERTEQVQAGISRDSALALLAAPAGGPAGATQTAGSDSLKNVWRRTQYLVDGQNIEVLWYSQDGEQRTATDTVPEGRIIPVVLIDGKVIGVGRAAYDQVAERFRLPKNRY